jgi:hypothetical protein
MSHTAAPVDPDQEPGDAEPDQPELSEMLDAEWLVGPARRSRGRMALVAALTVLLVFLGGVEVQKRWGSASSGASAGGFPSGTFARPQGATSGGAPTQLGAAIGSTAVGGTSTTGATTPAVIGTVTRIRAHTWTVKDLGGTSHVVKVTDTTTVTRPVKDLTAPVRSDAQVVVQGTTHGATVTATAVTFH